jgi:hypothetical protein
MKPNVQEPGKTYCKTPLSLSVKDKGYLMVGSSIHGRELPGFFKRQVIPDYPGDCQLQ